MSEQTSPDPVGAGWFEPGTPVENVAESRRACVACQTETDHSEFRVRGVPKLLRRRRAETPEGDPAHWSLCHECQSMYPIDERAHQAMRSLGMVTGFINR